MSKSVEEYKNKIIELIKNHNEFDSILTRQRFFKNVEKLRDEAVEKLTEEEFKQLYEWVMHNTRP